MVVMAVVASRMVTHAVDMATRALHLTVHLIENDAGDKTPDPG
jgi:hypothetical protein